MVRLAHRTRLDDRGARDGAQHRCSPVPSLRLLPAVGAAGRSARSAAVRGRAERGRRRDRRPDAQAVFATDNPRVATVDANGFVVPSAMAWRRSRRRSTARSRGRRSRSRTTTATSPGASATTSRPILTKQGCNSGACHGAAAGKNGFRLTLRGYGPEVDHAVLTRQALGRRVVKTAPQESLMLLKPTGAIEHGGGVRFTTGSLEYRVIAEWIAAGMPGPVGDRSRRSAR